MKLTFTGVGPDGSAKILVGEALPKTSRPVLPAGMIVALSTADLDRRKAAVLRLRRAALASDAVGPANLASGLRDQLVRRIGDRLQVVDTSTC